MMDKANPYAPPQTPDAGELWYPKGTAVMVRDGAVLPPIDLETGEEDDGLIQVTRRFSKAHWSSHLYIGTLPFVQFLPWRESLVAPATIVFAVIFLALVGVGIATMRRWRFRLHVDALRERRRKRRVVIQKALALVSVLLMLILPATAITTGGNMSDNLTQLFAVLLLIGLACLAGCGIWQYLTRPRIYLSGGKNGWVRIGSVSQVALKKLESVKDKP